MKPIPSNDMAILRLRIATAFVLIVDDPDGDRRWALSGPSRGDCVAAATGEYYNAHPIVYERRFGKWKRIFGKEWRS